LAFLGLSLTRKYDVGLDSVTHQTAFDLNRVQDRDYKYLFSSSDDGWLVGGGEPGPPQSYKLQAPDSAHVEIMRLGTFREDWGGISREVILAALQAGEILIPQIEVVPTAVVANSDMPPELEIRFDMEHKWGKKVNTSPESLPPLPVNWQLRFLHSQLFRRFQFPSRFCPGAFHSTILRKAEFRSEQHKAVYFEKCQLVVEEWKASGVQALVADPNNDTPGIRRVDCKDPTTGKLVQDPACQSGIYLFTDRNHITHHYAPNFLPPYDTPDKRKIILDILKEEWDEKTLSWKPVVFSVEEEKPKPREEKPSGQPVVFSVEEEKPKPREEKPNGQLKMPKESTKKEEEISQIDTVLENVMTACTLETCALD
jgi:hypothetical protein